MDDTSVQKVNEKEVLAAKAYLLFYNKQLRSVSNHQELPEPFAQLSSFSTFEHSMQPIPGLIPTFSKQPPQNNPLSHSGCTSEVHFGKSVPCNTARLNYTSVQTKSMHHTTSFNNAARID